MDMHDDAYRGKFMSRYQATLEAELVEAARRFEFHENEVETDEVDTLIDRMRRALTRTRHMNLRRREVVVLGHSERQSSMEPTQMLARELESTALVRFQDSDPFGHLNNARYIDYFMNARLDQVWNYYQFDIFAEGAKINAGWVVTRNQIVYLTPAPLGEEVIIQTGLVKVTDNMLTVEGVMMDKSRRRIKAVCWIEFTLVSMETGRHVNHTEGMMALFNAVQVDERIYDAGFDARVAAHQQVFRERRKEARQVA